MAEEDEVRMEVEAVESVYGYDCIVLNRFPPHLHLHIQPRTAEVHSQQFVEAIIELRAGLQYPSDPPYIDIIASKGLDEERQKHLSNKLHDMAHELDSCLMLVALCEEAVETLTSMNHPEGDCPLCLYPLVSEDCRHSEAQTFMKLMSCFHCFHCECIVRWLKWIQKQNEDCCRTSSTLSSVANEENNVAIDLRKMMGDGTRNCPVCRKVFRAKDIEHVLNLVGSHDADSDVYEEELMEKVLQCDTETSRRQKFEAILELQQQHGGLIEPPKGNILFSRLSLRDLVSEDAEAGNGAVTEQQDVNRIVLEEPGSSSSSNQTRETRRRQHQRGPMVEPATSSPQSRPSAGQRRHYGMRKHSRNHQERRPSRVPGRNKIPED